MIVESFGNYVFLDKFKDLSGGTTEYSELCTKYDKLPPEEKIKVQISKYYVWKVEINSIKWIWKSAKLNDIEKLLLEDQQNVLQKEAWECREEIYRLYHNELPQNYPEAEKLLKKIEGAHVSLEMPVTKRNIDFDKYITLSPMERILLLISQSRMLEVERLAVSRRRKSLKIDEYERPFLNYRLYFLSECISTIPKCITFTFATGFTRDSPEAKEFYKKIQGLDFPILFRDHNFADKEHYRYPYDFKRPNEVPPDEWKHPNIKWKT